MSVCRCFSLSSCIVVKDHLDRAVSPEPSLLAHTSSESRGTFRQKTRSLAPLNGWICAVEICHDGMLEDTNSLYGAHLTSAEPKKQVTIVPAYVSGCVAKLSRLKRSWTCALTCLSTERHVRLHFVIFESSEIVIIVSFKVNFFLLAKTEENWFTCIVTVCTENCAFFCSGIKFTNLVKIYEACSEIGTLEFYPEHIDVGKQNSAFIIMDLLWSYFAIKFGAYCVDFNSSVTLVTRDSYNRSQKYLKPSFWQFSWLTESKYNIKKNGTN